MVEKIKSLLRDRRDSLYQEDGLLTEREFEILQQVFLPEGMSPDKKSLIYIPKQRRLGRKRTFGDVNPTLLEAAEKLSPNPRVIWGYVDAYVSGLQKIETYIEGESREEHRYVSRQQRRQDPHAHWKGLD